MTNVRACCSRPAQRFADEARWTMAAWDIDLHGSVWSEGLAQFIELYNAAVSSEGPGVGVPVVHGYGSTGVGGVLRSRLRGFLARHADKLEFTPGEDIDGNQGWTHVTGRLPLPGEFDQLAEDIWDYCRQPRAGSKVDGRFRRHGSPRIAEAVRSLKRQGRLTEVHNGRVPMYEAR